jgi:hypothetical protein
MREPSHPSRLLATGLAGTLGLATPAAQGALAGAGIRRGGPGCR